MSPPRWRPLPSHAAFDPRVRHVSDAACRVWFLLVCVSDVDGVIRDTGMLSTGEVVSALADLEGGRAAGVLDELTHAGLVSLDDGEILVPDVPRWQAEHAPRSSAAAAPNPAPSPRQHTAEDMDRREATKRLGARWSDRKIKSPEARVAWLQSEAGRSYLDKAGISLALATAIATGVTAPVTGDVTGVTGGVTAVTETVTAGVTEAVTAGSPSHSPSGEKIGENRGEERARGPVTGAVTAPVTGDRSGVTATVTARVTDRGGPRHGATPSEPSPTPSSKVPEGSVEEVLHDLVQRSEGGFSVSGSVDQREAVVAALLAAGVDLDATGAALARPWDVWPRWARIAEQRCVSVAQLAGRAPFACEGVAELVAYVRAQGAEAISTSTIPGVEETAAREKALRLRREAIRKGPPLVVPPLNLRRAPASTTATATATASEVRDG